jgi:hypothetical protein
MTDGGGGTPVASASPAATRALGSTATSPSVPTSASPAPADLTDSAGGVSLRYAGGAQVRPGNGSKVLWLDGSPEGYAGAPGPVVDTTRGFTVSAWVLLKQPQGGSMTVSQGDGGYYTFALGRDYWTGHHGWVFKVQTRAGNSDSYVRAAKAAGEAKLDTWVFLTSTYDAIHHTIARHVDGKLAGQSPAPGIWQNGGALQLGRTRHKNAWSDNRDGAIAHVQLWKTPLTVAQVARSDRRHRQFTLGAYTPGCRVRKSAPEYDRRSLLSRWAGAPGKAVRTRQRKSLSLRGGPA